MPKSFKSQHNQAPVQQGAQMHSANQMHGAHKSVVQPTQQVHHRPQKSVRKNENQSRVSNNSSSTHSPPLHAKNSSKVSKSRRADPHEVPPISCTDYVFLLIYYCCLYTFYAAFWFSLWAIYKATTPDDGPRFLHSGSYNLTRINITDGSRSSINMDDSDLFKSLTEDQRRALQLVQCNGTLKIGDKIFEWINL